MTAVAKSNRHVLVEENNSKNQEEVLISTEYGDIINNIQEDYVSSEPKKSQTEDLIDSDLIEIDVYGKNNPSQELSLEKSPQKLESVFKQGALPTSIATYKDTGKDAAEGFLSMAKNGECAETELNKINNAYKENQSICQNIKEKFEDIKETAINIRSFANICLRSGPAVLSMGSMALSTYMMGNPYFYAYTGAIGGLIATSNFSPKAGGKIITWGSKIPFVGNVFKPFDHVNTSIDEAIVREIISRTLGFNKDLISLIFDPERAIANNVDIIKASKVIIDGLSSYLPEGKIKDFVESANEKLDDIVEIGYEKKGENFNDILSDIKNVAGNVYLNLENRLERRTNKENKDIDIDLDSGCAVKIMDASDAKIREDYENPESLAEAEYKRQPVIIKIDNYEEELNKALNNSINPPISASEKKMQPLEKDPDYEKAIKKTSDNLSRKDHNSKVNFLYELQKYSFNYCKDTALNIANIANSANRSYPVLLKLLSNTGSVGLASYMMGTSYPVILSTAGTGALVGLSYLSPKTAGKIITWGSKIPYISSITSPFNNISISIEEALLQKIICKKAAMVLDPKGTLADNVEKIEAAKLVLKLLAAKLPEGQVKSLVVLINEKISKMCEIGYEIKGSNPSKVADDLKKIIDFTIGSCTSSKQDPSKEKSNPSEIKKQIITSETQSVSSKTSPSINGNKTEGWGSWVSRVSNKSVNMANGLLKRII